MTTKTSCFTWKTLNPSTYRVVQNDILKELPFIYVKVYPTLLLLVDTGCGPNHCMDPTVEEKSIRSYIETNLEAEGRLTYVDPETNETKNKHWLVFITHTHYDHIGGLFEFADDSSVFISGNDRDYILKDLGCNSLCCAFNIPTPKFTVAHWLQQNEKLTFNGVDLHLESLLTPGHTPDEIALYDSEEHVIYAGDSLYEVLPIYIIETSNMIEYIGSMETLLKFVREKNEATGKRLITYSGHITDNVDTENLIVETIACFWDTLKGKAVLDKTMVMREKNLLIYMSENRNVGFMCIDTKLEEAKKHFGFEWPLPTSA
ncbi:beta-lactamase-like protein [Lipomyces arxii]|uniref:beta-lactamase-like protein n=1 Tax=Lipomyces arxii TaxID=56418 RepID=UPI0034CF0ABA